MSKQTQLRKILREVIRLPANADHNNPIFTKSAAEFARVLGRPIEASDLTTGKTEWPANRLELKFRFENAVKQHQSGKEKGIAPELVVSRGHKREEEVGDDTENHVLEDAEFKLSAKIIKSFKDLHKSIVAEEKSTASSKKKKRQASAKIFASLGSEIFDALFAERDDQEVGRARPLIYDAIIHPSVSKAQRDTVQAISRPILDQLIGALNVERQQFHRLEDTFPALEKRAESECQSCEKFAKRALAEVDQSCKPCVRWMQAKKELEKAEQKGVKNKIKKAQDDLDDAAQVLHSEFVRPQIDKFNDKMYKRLLSVYLASDTEAEDLDQAGEPEMKIEKETSAQRKARLQRFEADIQKGNRANFVKRAKESHPDWTDAQVEEAVQAVLAAIDKQFEAGHDAAAAKKADKQYQAAEKYLLGKGGKKPIKPVIAAVKARADADDDEEDDEEYDPEGSDSSSSSDDDDDEEDENEDEAAAGGSTTPTKTRLRQPKTYIGSGSFGTSPAQPVGWFRPSLRLMARPPTAITPQATTFRVGGSPYYYQEYLPNNHQSKRGRRVGGGCGCGGPPPKDDEDM